MLNIVIPMAGRGSRFATAGFKNPKPLIELGGRPMIQWVIDNIRPQRPHRFVFVCLGSHLEEHPEVETMLRKLAPGCVVLRIGGVTAGAACTVLTARDLIDSDDPLMIANSDQFVDCDIEAYLAAGDAAGVGGHIMTFWADSPKWSYCRLDPNTGNVTEVVEKQVVSNDATVGIYNFASGRSFVRSADAMIRNDQRVNGEFYVAPVYNGLIAEGVRVIPYNIVDRNGAMHGLGTPEDYKAFQCTATFRRHAAPERRAPTGR